MLGGFFIVNVGSYSKSSRLRKIFLKIIKIKRGGGLKSNLLIPFLFHLLLSSPLAVVEEEQQSQY